MEPKDRLRQAIAEAGYENPTAAWIAHKRLFTGKVGKDLLISNCNGNRAISKRAAEVYARAFGHTPGWYLYGHGDDEGASAPVSSISIVDVPLVSWVTAGELAAQETVAELADYPTIPAADLPAGRYIALKVEPDSHSMNKISPPESVIFVNLDDKRLAPNACYVIADESGAATYKRYRPSLKPVFQPVSYKKIDPPKLEGVITVVGRVRRSMIDM